MKTHYTDSKENLAKKRLKSIKEMMQIIENCDNDYQRAIKLRRIYSSYDNFRVAYYPKIKTKAGAYITALDDLYMPYEAELTVLGSLYKRYEEEGFFKLALKEEAFLLRQCNDLDSRYIVNAYINDFESYDSESFYSKYRINSTIFKACVSRIKNHDEVLYSKYLETFENNKTKRLVMPIYSINQIIEGITSGKTIDGKKFDIYEFFRLAPFKNRDIDYEIRVLSKDFPNLLKFKKLKQDYKFQSTAKGATICTYSDNLYLFASCFNQKQANILKEYMDQNNIRNLTPIYRGSTVNFYSNIDENSETEFTKNDAIEIFDAMDRENLPYFQEVYSRLKKEKLSKKLIKENK